MAWGIHRWKMSLLSLVVALIAGLASTTPVVAGAGLPALPLSTDGNEIVDCKGRTVVLQGVNWFGFETANHVPHGLWSRDYKDMLRQIKREGFNTIRLPFSLEAVRSADTSGIDYANGRNAALRGKTPLEVMDILVAEAGRQGLMIILDNHSQADDGFMYPLWFGQDGFTERDWISTWRKLADRFDDNPNVIAADLKNEPHGSATWGTGGATDWRRAAEVAGAAVQAVNPDLLIIVEGIEGPVAGGKLDVHWWGGNLEGVRSAPVRLPVPNKLVYSPHEYGPGVFAQPWFSDPKMTSILTHRWETGFGYIHTQGIAPLLIGEFGAKNVGTDTVEGRWINQFTDYLGRTGISWTFWSWNPNSGDTGGILTDDWTTVHRDKMGLLSALMDRQSGAI
jgi:endoglucanase